MADLTFASPIQSSRQLQRLFWIFLILNVAFILWSKNFLQPLQTRDIIRFEIAKKVPVAEGILQEWTANDGIKLNKAIQGIYLDYLFIVLYTVGLSIASVYFSQLTGHQILKRAGRFIQFLIIGAGVCDIIENSAMLNSLDGHLNGWNVWVAYDMAVTKFSILIVSVLFLLVCLVYYSLQRIVK
ncbi:MAG: hypothetical protein H7Y42_09425 [Chitinophagaceae bacterium]|nr:hypothetical protein [Chitinophagaceae bacterium]